MPQNQRHHPSDLGRSNLARTTDAHGIRCNLAMEMAARKLTVRGLSEATGVHTSAISKLRAGHFSMLDCQNLEKLAGI